MSTRARVVSLAPIASLALAACGQAPAGPARVAAPARIAVAFYGDSLTEEPGYAGFVGGGFASIVRGLSGELGTDGSARFAADLGELVTVEKVGAAVLMWGTNDVGWLDYSEPALVASLSDAVGEAVRRGLRVVVALPPDLLEGEALELRNARLASYRSALAARLATSFAESGAVRVADLAPRFAGHPDPPSLYTDGVHFSEAGKALAGAAVEAELRPLLSGAARR